jgi:hypothetical protein
MVRVSYACRDEHTTVSGLTHAMIFALIAPRCREMPPVMRRGTSIPSGVSVAVFAPRAVLLCR